MRLLIRESSESPSGDARAFASSETENGDWICGRIRLRQTTGTAGLSRRTCDFAFRFLLLGKWAGRVQIGRPVRVSVIHQVSRRGPVQGTCQLHLALHRRPRHSHQERDLCGVQEWNDERQSTWS